MMEARQITFSQRSFLLKIYVATIAVVAVYALLFPLLKPTVEKIVLVTILGIALIGGYFFAWRSHDHTRPSHYYLISCYLVLLANAITNGGVGAPGIIWFIVCPLIAFITLSTRFARIWLIIIEVTVVLLFVFDKTIGEPELLNQDGWYFTSYILFFPMVFSIMRIFRREVSKRNVALTELNRRLTAERKMLEETQQEIISQSEQIKQAETRAQERSAKLGYYLDQLIEVKRMDEIHNGNLEFSIAAILRFLQKSMALTNVALFHLNSNGQELRLMRYMGDGDDVFERAFLYRGDFADAYEMLQSGAIINQCDRIKESIELKELFCNSVGNESMINCPYFLEGKFAGFISCRSVDRVWLAEDIIFVRAISDTISIAFKSHQRVQHQQLLEQKQREITEINALLERKVMERTNKLNIRNKQLTEFAFTNAHHIRGPICRLLGLKNILDVTEDCNEIIEISNYMSTSIVDLDEITRQTSEKLNALMDDQRSDL
jgi:hypothetical protein